MVARTVRWEWREKNVDNDDVCNEYRLSEAHTGQESLESSHGNSKQASTYLIDADCLKARFDNQWVFKMIRVFFLAKIASNEAEQTLLTPGQRKIAPELEFITSLDNNSTDLKIAQE